MAKCENYEKYKYRGCLKGKAYKSSTKKTKKKTKKVKKVKTKRK